MRPRPVDQPVCPSLLRPPPPPPPGMLSPGQPGLCVTYYISVLVYPCTYMYIVHVWTIIMHVCTCLCIALTINVHEDHVYCVCLCSCCVLYRSKLYSYIACTISLRNNYITHKLTRTVYMHMYKCTMYVYIQIKVSIQ